MKSVRIRVFFGSVFSCIRTEYGDLPRKSPFSAQMQEKKDQKELCIWTLFTLCFNPLTTLKTKRERLRPLRCLMDGMFRIGGRLEFTELFISGRGVELAGGFL